MLPQDPVILLSYVNTKLRSTLLGMTMTPSRTVFSKKTADVMSFENITSAVFFYTRSFSSAKLWMVGSSSST